jgi:uncharacterized SAM-binding protein YcdF (DUF218 family)
MLRRRLLAVLLLMLFAAGLLFVARRPLLVAACRWLDVGQRPQPADYVAVLGGGEETRPFAAALLVKRHLAREVLVPRQWNRAEVVHWIVLSDEELTRQVLLRRGVPASRIHLIGKGVVSTFDEALAVAEFLHPRPSARVMVVTNDYHTRRARWAFARVLDHSADRLTVVSIPEDEFSPENWWRTSAGRLQVTGEYAKLLYYQFRYGDGMIWLLVAGLALAGSWYGRSLLRGRRAKTPLAATLAAPTPPSCSR